MSKGAAKTGMGPTALVAMEQFFPENQRGITDSHAINILSASMKLFVKLMKYEFMRNWMQGQSEKATPGIWAGMFCRKNYIDEKLLNAADSIESVVNLGAGFDSRFFRLKTIQHVPFFEVDQPVNIEKKRSILNKNFTNIPSTLKLISVDFDTEEILPALEKEGYALSQKTFFIMEGLTQYISEEGLQQTFDFLSKAPKGSETVFTYVRKEFLEGKNMFNFERGYKEYVIKNQTWLFGLDPAEWPSFLSQFGWKVKEDIGYDELHDTYVTPLNRGLVSTQLERIIHAVKS